jgi:hypothetical protein
MMDALPVAIHNLELEPNCHLTSRHTEVNEDAWELGRAYELEEQPRCLSYRLAYLVASFYDMP